LISNAVTSFQAERMTNTSSKTQDPTFARVKSYRHSPVCVRADTKHLSITCKNTHLHHIRPQLIYKRIRTNRHQSAAYTIDQLITPRIIIPDQLVEGKSRTLTCGLHA
jgi:hypothetical protein